MTYKPEIMKLLTVKEIAEMLGVKPKTIYQWVLLGQIPFYKLNGSVRFDLDDIRGWVLTCKKSPTAGYNPLIQARSPRKGVKN
jgi:excisionase family DNA binding protein